MAFTLASQYGPSEEFNPAGLLLKSIPFSVFLPGTTTLAALWTDQTKATPAANPGVTSSLANMTFFADPGRYDVLCNGTTLQVVLYPDPADVASTTDPRLSDSRTPSDGSVTDVKVNAVAAIAQSKISGLVTALAGKAPIAMPTYTVGAAYLTGQLVKVSGVIFQAKVDIAVAPNPIDYTTWNVLDEHLFVDPITHGAAGNTIKLTDVVMTNGSANVASASATFALTGNGKTFVIQGAGVAGAPLIGTQSAFVDIHNITLSVAASSPVSGAECWYGSLDSAAFTAAQAISPYLVLRHDRLYMLDATFVPGTASGIVGPPMQLSATTGNLRCGIVFAGVGNFLSPASASFFVQDIAVVDASGKAAGNVAVNLTNDMRAFRVQWFNWATCTKGGASTFYTTAAFCEWNGCGTAFDMGTQQTNLHIVEPTARTTDCFVKVGQVGLPVTLFGGSVEGYGTAGAFQFTGTHGQLNMSGTYFESTVLNNVFIAGANGCTIMLDNCYGQLAKCAKVVDCDAKTGVTLISRGNKFAINDATTTPILYALPDLATATVDIAPDDVSQMLTASTRFTSAGVTFTSAHPAIHVDTGVVGSDYFGYNWEAQDVTSGETTIPRLTASTASVLVASTLHLTYFTARKVTAAGHVRTIVGSPAAGATPTLCRVGLYTVAANGDLTLVASTANSTSLWNSTFQAFNTALSVAYTTIPGQRYAVGLLCVTAAALPSLYSYANLPSSEIGTMAPIMSTTLVAQSDLPASVANGSLVASNKVFYAAVLV